MVMFPQQAVTATHVRENLLRMKALTEPTKWTRRESKDLSGIDLAEETSVPPIPHPTHYADWFSYFDNIDLRRHLRDIEVVLIEALAKWSHGQSGSNSTETSPYHAHRENEETND